MAKADVVSLKFSTEGAKKAQSEITELAGTLKVLGAENKAIQAEFKRTGNEQEYLEKSYENLNKQLQAQKKQADIAKNALAQLAKQGVAETDKRVQSMKTNLANATAGMIETQSSIDNVVSRVHELGGTFVEVGETATGASKDIGSVGSEFDTTGAKESASDVATGVEGASASAAETKEKVGEVGGEFDTTGAKTSADQVSEDVSGAADSAEETKDDIAGVGDEFDTTGAAASADTVSEDVAGAADSATDTKTKIGEVGDEFETTGAETSATDTSEKVAGAAASAEETKAAIAGVGGEFDTTGVGTSANDVSEKIKWPIGSADETKNAIAGIGGEFETGGVEGSAGDVQEAVNGIDGSGAQTELGKIGQAIDIQGALSSIKSIEDGLSGVVKKAANAAKALFSMGADSGKWADELITTASVMGISTTELQQMRDASNYIDTSVETMESAMTRIAQNRDSKSWLESLGNLGDASGTKIEIDGQSSLEVLGQIIDALTQIEDFSQREELATNLLGRSAKDFNPIIDAGGWQAYLEQMEKAPVVAEDLVKSLGSLDDANNGAQASLDALKHEVMAELAPAFEDGAKALTEFVEKLREFVQSEKGQAAINSLSEAMTNLINAFTSEENVETVFSLITTAVEKLTDALKWMSENSDTLVGAIKAIGAAFGLLKVSESVLTFMQLGRSVSGLFNKNPQAPSTSSAPSVPGAGGLPVAGKAASLLGKVAPAAPWVATFLAAGLGSYLVDKNYVEQTYGGYHEAEGKRDTVNSQWSERTSKLREDVEKANADLDEAKGLMLDMGSAGEEVAEAQKKLVDAGYDIGQTGVDGVWGENTQAAAEKYVADMEAAAKATEEANAAQIERREHISEMMNAAFDLENMDEEDYLGGLKDFWNNYAAELEASFPDMDIWQLIKDHMGTDGKASDFSIDELLAGGFQIPNFDTFATQAAENLTTAMETEIANGSDGISTSVKGVTDAASQQAETDLANGGTAGGAGFDMSIAEAIAANAEAVYAAASQMGANAAAAFDAAYKSNISAPASSSSPGYGGGGGGTANVTIELNGQKLGEAVAPIVDREIGSAAKKRR